MRTLNRAQVGEGVFPPQPPAGFKLLGESECAQLYEGVGTLAGMRVDLHVARYSDGRRWLRIGAGYVNRTGGILELLKVRDIFVPEKFRAFVGLPPAVFGRGGRPIRIWACVDPSPVPDFEQEIADEATKLEAQAKAAAAKAAKARA